jgi:hypothetical protein
MGKRQNKFYCDLCVLPIIEDYNYPDVQVLLKVGCKPEYKQEICNYQYVCTCCFDKLIKGLYKFSKLYPNLYPTEDR